MKPIKKIFPLLIIAAMALLSPTALRGRAITLGFEFSGRQEVVDKASLASQEGSLLGFSIGGMGFRGASLGLEGALSYTLRKADQIGYGLNKISDFSVYIGGRYYSWDPTFSLGNIEVRLTFSALGGFSWLSGGEFSTLPQFSPLLSGGLSISTSGSPADIMVEFVYRPVSMDMEMRGAWNVLVGTLEIKPSWCIRVSLLLF